MVALHTPRRAATARTVRKWPVPPSTTAIVAAEAGTLLQGAGSNRVAKRWGTDAVACDGCDVTMPSDALIWSFGCDGSRALRTTVTVDFT